MKTQKEMTAEDLRKIYCAAGKRWMFNEKIPNVPHVYRESQVTNYAFMKECIVTVDEDCNLHCKSIDADDIIDRDKKQQQVEFYKKKYEAVMVENANLEAELVEKNALISDYEVNIRGLQATVIKLEDDIKSQKQVVEQAEELKETYEVEEVNYDKMKRNELLKVANKKTGDTKENRKKTEEELRAICKNN